MPLAISEPSTTAPCPFSIKQFEIRTRRVATGSLFASEILPDLIEMQSSPVEKCTPTIATSWHESGLIPSVFGESNGASTFNFANVTFCERNGCSVHDGELRTATPSTAIPFDRTKNTVRGRHPPNGALGLLHHVSSDAFPSITPSP